MTKTKQKNKIQPIYTIRKKNRKDIKRHAGNDKKRAVIKIVGAWTSKNYSRPTK